jgi:hypothetical protein
MGGIARRLHRHRLAVEPGRKPPLALEAVEDRIEMLGEAGVERHWQVQIRETRGSTGKPRPRSSAASRG